MKQRFLHLFPLLKHSNRPHKTRWGFFFLISILLSLPLLVFFNLQSFRRKLPLLPFPKQIQTRIALALTWEAKTPISLETYTYLQALVPALNNLSIINTLMTQNEPITLFMFQSPESHTTQDLSTSRPRAFGIIINASSSTNNLLTVLKDTPTENFIFRPPFLFLFSQPLSRREQTALLEELRPIISSPQTNTNTNILLHGFLKTSFFTPFPNKFHISPQEVLTSPNITFSLTSAPQKKETPENTHRSDIDDILFSSTMPFASIVKYMVTQSPNTAPLLLSLPQKEKTFYNALLARHAILQRDSDSHFLLSIETTGNREEEFELLLKEIIARLFPQEIPTTLPDGTSANEIVISPSLFSFQTNNNGEKRLLSGAKDVQLYTAFNDSRYTISNSLPLLQKFLSQGDISGISAVPLSVPKECLFGTSLVYTLSLPTAEMKQEIVEQNFPFVNLLISLLQEKETLFIDFSTNNVSFCIF